MKKIIFSLIILFSIAQMTVAQNEEFKALYMYNVTKFIEWPNIGDKFVICAIGNPSTIAKLTELHSGKKVAGKPIEVKSNIDPANIPDCELLFLPANKNDLFKDVLSKVKGKPVLLITDGKGFAKQGSCLNFAIIDGKLDLEINRRNIEAQGLKVNQQLLELGIGVD